MRTYVGELMDGPVVEAVSQVHGCAPGSADRVRTLSRRRALIQAVSRDRNPATWTLHRQERAVPAGLSGSFLEAAGRPAPPHMPGIRTFHRREAMAGLDWLRTR